jgi:polysaccharide export outer membrane protein
MRSLRRGCPRVRERGIGPYSVSSKSHRANDVILIHERCAAGVGPVSQAARAALTLTLHGGEMERPHAGSTVVLVLVGCLIGFLPACGSTGGAIEVEQLKEPPDPSPAGGEYTIGIGDVLSIQVFDQDKMSAKVRVRTDGRITVPFLNDVVAAGKAPVKLAGELEEGLKSVVLNPKVTVFVEESKPPTMSVSVLGEVSKPGVQLLEPGVGVAQALASAGGLTPFAKKDRIFVVRGGAPTRIRFRYEALTRAVGPASLFRLRAGDVVIVE